METLLTICLLITFFLLLTPVGVLFLNAPKKIKLDEYKIYLIMLFRVLLIVIQSYSDWIFCFDKRKKERGDEIGKNKRFIGRTI